MSIFKKCQDFYSDPDFIKKVGWPTSPRTAEALGLYPYFIPLEETDGTEVVINGNRLIMIGSNNYLGLTNHPELKEAAVKAIEKYGTGCTGSRFLNGTLDIHKELEKKLAAFVRKEDAIVFSTGFQTNLGTISCIAGKDDLIVLDKENHASIVDGALLARRRSGAKIKFFRHSAIESLEAILKRQDSNQNKLVVFDAVYSMSGDIAPLPEIVDVCKRYKAAIMIDEAHSLGVLGDGRGVAHHFGLADEIDLIMGTFSKSLASIGGFIAGSKEVIHWIKHFARSFMFSASLPPASVGTVLKAIEIIQREPERIENVLKISEHVRTELTNMGFDTGCSKTPIIPVVIGDQFRAMQTWDYLFKHGIYTNVALPPAVKSSNALIRTSYMATHSDEQIEKVLTVFSRAKDRVLKKGWAKQTK